MQVLVLILQFLLIWPAVRAGFLWSDVQAESLVYGKLFNEQGFPLLTNDSLDDKYSTAYQALNRSLCDALLHQESIRVTIEGCSIDQVRQQNDGIFALTRILLSALRCRWLDHDKLFLQFEESWHWDIRPVKFELRVLSGKLNSTPEYHWLYEDGVHVIHNLDSQFNHSLSLRAVNFLGVSEPTEIVDDIMKLTTELRPVRYSRPHLSLPQHKRQYPRHKRFHSTRPLMHIPTHSKLVWAAIDPTELSQADLNNFLHNLNRGVINSPLPTFYPVPALREHHHRRIPHSRYYYHN
ncbi:hypothetical protein Ciccas_005135 [Cichlidogyrus casuarinus]|uniref:Uncharacterized protein n=1 Tax=Cichlidogyrus casuarinus TaxID=1844966 RepID=A0ABD2Q9K2_9PLAT